MHPQLPLPWFCCPMEHPPHCTHPLSVLLTNPVLPLSSDSSQSRAAIWLFFQPILCCHLASLPANPMLPPGFTSSQSSANTQVLSQSCAATCVPSQACVAPGFSSSQSRAIAPVPSQSRDAPLGLYKTSEAATTPEGLCTVFGEKSQVFLVSEATPEHPEQPPCGGKGLPAPHSSSLPRAR